MLNHRRVRLLPPFFLFVQFALMFGGMEWLGPGTNEDTLHVLRTLTLPRGTWVDGYHDVLEPRALKPITHNDATVRAFAEELLTEIEIFRRSEGSYGYTFFIPERA